MSAGLEILRRCGDSSHKGLRIACTTWAMDIVVQYLYLYSRSRHVFIALLAVRVLGFLGDHPEHLDEMRRKDALSDMPRDLRDELLTAIDQVRTRLGRGGDDASNSGGRVGGDASCNNQFKICWPREKLIDDLRSSNVDPLDHPDRQLEVIRKWTKHGKAKYYSNDNRCLYCLKQYHRDVIPSKVDGNTYQEVHSCHQKRQGTTTGRSLSMRLPRVFRVAMRSLFSALWTPSLRKQRKCVLVRHHVPGKGRVRGLRPSLDRPVAHVCLRYPVARPSASH